MFLFHPRETPLIRGISCRCRRTRNSFHVLLHYIATDVMRRPALPGHTDNTWMSSLTILPPRTHSLISNRPNNLYRKWMSCRGVCVCLHQFSPHLNCSRAWLHPLISLNQHSGGISVLTSQVRTSALIELSHERVRLVYTRPASEQLRGISLVIR